MAPSQPCLPSYLNPRRLPRFPISKNQPNKAHINMSSSSITAQMTPPVGGDQNRGPQLMAMFWTETPVSMLLLSLRSYARVSIRGVGYDDWIMLATVGGNSIS